MPKARQRNREIYDRGARIYAMAANMLEGVDREEWKARGLSEGDVRFALSLIPPSGMPDTRWGFPSGPISDSMW